MQCYSFSTLIILPFFLQLSSSHCCPSNVPPIIPFFLQLSSSHCSILPPIVFISLFHSSSSLLLLILFAPLQSQSLSGPFIQPVSERCSCVGENELRSPTLGEYRKRATSETYRPLWNWQGLTTQTSLSTLSSCYLVVMRVPSNPFAIAIVHP